VTTAWKLEGLPPGQHQGALEVSRLAGGEALQVPYRVLVGAERRPRVVITAGVHGDEFEGVHAAGALAQLLDPVGLRGTVVLVPVVNPPAFGAAQRVSPLDGVNLNRVFPGDEHGTLSERLAAAVFRTFVAGADALIDLHSGGTRYLFQPQAGFYRMPDAPALTRRSLEMARAFGLPLVWEVTHRAGVLSYEAMRAGVAAIGCEIGGNGRAEAEHVALATRGVLGVLAHLGVCGPPAAPPPQRVWRGDFTLAPASGLFRAEVALGQEIRSGELLYTLLDTFGAVRHQQRATHDGLVSAIRIFGMIQEGEWDVAVLEDVTEER
jgi:predicted deacylase